MSKGKISDLTGQRFGRLTAIKRVGSNERGESLWECLCDCGNTTISRAWPLKCGRKKSCGCYKKDIDIQKIIKAGKENKKTNTYDLTKEYGIGYTNKNQEFYFDLEDYDKIKEYCWTINSKGYVISRENKKTICMHRLVMGVNNSDEIIDHIIPENKTDNRKNNLRIVTRLENAWNRPAPITNTSGYLGVGRAGKDKWLARIRANNEYHYLGIYTTKEEAAEARKEAEKKYFGDYRYKGNE